MEKEYDYVVKLKFGGSMTSTNKKNAIEGIKNSFREEYNIELVNKEINIINIAIDKSVIKV